MSLRSLIVCLILSAAPAWGEPTISEFLASNQASVEDEDGDNSDWIEIFNPDTSPVSLNGWFLTDSAANKSKWTFPNVTLAGRSTLLVWASGKNRRVAGQPLHTNFSLSASGEYLALVRPDGVTAAREFAPQYVPQFADVSYGTSGNTTDFILVDKPTAVRSIAPVDNTLGATWRARTFDDAAWFAGTFAVGFMNYNSTSNPNLQADLGVDLKALYPTIGGTGRNGYVRARFNVTNPTLVSELKLRMSYDDGFHAWINGTPVTNSPGAPAEGALVFNSPAGQSHAPGLFDEFNISSKISTLLPGENVLAIQILNTNTTSSDLFASPQLVAGIETGGGGVTGYFGAATPNLINGGPNTIQLPQAVVASRPSGPFTATFDLTLSGAPAGYEIRYVIADPSGSPGANIAQPSAVSTLYTAPISIATSKLIRAAIFDPATGQRGRTQTLHYFLLETGAVNNTSNFTSNLPIIVTDDHGAGQPIDSNSSTYTSALLYLFEPAAGVTTLNSTPALFTRAGLRIRGSSSAGFAKKSYGMETWDELSTDRDLPLFNLPSDSDWVLNGPFLFDDTYIHNAFIFEISRQIGRWAPRTRAAEMFFNQNGGKLDNVDYAGVYMLTEKIKSTNERIKITSIRPEDSDANAITGGYIFKIDRADPDEVAFTIPANTVAGVPILPNQESGQSLVIVEPDPQADTPAQTSYLQNHLRDFHVTLFNERNTSFATRNYRNFIDVPSFIDHHILNSLAYNVDALRLSGYFFKDRGGKINAGPIWDFDRALGSDDGRDANPQSWGAIQYFFDRDWWGPLFRDPDFVQAWVDRWQQLRAGPTATANLHAVANVMGMEIGNAAGLRDATKWPENAASGGVYLNEITAMRNYLTSRMAWIDGQMPAAPTASVASGVVNAGTAVTLTGAAGTIRYTLNGADPRPAGGGVPGTGTAYTGPIVINQTTIVTARRQLPTTTQVFSGISAPVGINWGGLVTRVYLVNEFFAEAGDIAVSEINYHPLGATAGESAAVPGVTAEDFEFIELKNVGTRTVNLFEVQLPDGKPFNALRLAPLTLMPGDYALVVRNRAAFTARYGAALSGKIAGEWREGLLGDDGETVRLLARSGAVIQDFTYQDSDDWPGRADGKGATLEYVGATFTNADYNNGANYRSSGEFQGSPGVAGTGPDTSVTINEILSNTASPVVDAIELRNNTGADIDVSGWYLSNAASAEDPDDYKQFRIPNGTVLPANGYLAFTEADFGSAFLFDGNHDNEAWLFHADLAGKLSRFGDRVQFGPARLNESFGRFPDGFGHFFPLSQSTLGAANAAPRVGPLVINEIHYAPTGAGNDLEFVEIHNPNATAQSLTNWRLRGEVDFDFTPTDSIAAGGLLVVVPFATDNLAKVAAFRAAYGISAAVPLAGPWNAPNHLGGTGTVTLTRPGAPPANEPGYFPQTIEDEAPYRSAPPWPAAAGGFSINRRGPATIGAFGESWRANVPSPGTLGVTFAQWMAFYFPAGGPGSGANDDFDLDSATNFSEYGRGTSPTTFENQALFEPILTSPGGANLVLTYLRPLDRPNAQFQVERSSDLVTWTPVSDTLLSTAGSFETRQATVPITPPTPAFLRLKTTFSP